MSRHEYSNNEITVYWDSGVCIHSGVCVRGLPGVFNPQERPWINVDGADAEKIAARINHCPSGALSYKLHNDSSVSAAKEKNVKDMEVEITASENGPLLIKGKIRIVDKDGQLIKEVDKGALCRCGQSSNKPFCDGTHRKAGFRT